MGGVRVPDKWVVVQTEEQGFLEKQNLGKMVEPGCLIQRGGRRTELMSVLVSLNSFSHCICTLLYYSNRRVP